VWEEHSLRVSENRVLRRIFRPKREEMTGNWRKLYNEDLGSFYCSLNIAVIRKGWLMYVCMYHEWEREVHLKF
jgi:hypothetical protein